MSGDPDGGRPFATGIRSLWLVAPAISDQPTARVDARLEENHDIPWLIPANYLVSAVRYN